LRATTLGGEGKVEMEAERFSAEAQEQAFGSAEQ
jgi:hypothetical protein